MGIISRTDRLSLRVAMHGQALEGNPLDADQVAMFEMFDREGWSDAQRLAFINERAAKAAAKWRAAEGTP